MLVDHRQLRDLTIAIPLVNFFARQLAHVAREANEVSNSQLWPLAAAGSSAENSRAQGNIAVLPLLNLIRRCASDGHLTVLHPLVLQVSWSHGFSQTARINL